MTKGIGLICPEQEKKRQVSCVKLKRITQKRYRCSKITGGILVLNFQIFIKIFLL